MIGEFDIRVDGKDYTIRADWRTGQLIAERFADPFSIMQDYAKTEFMETIGGVHDQKHEINMTAAVVILHAGLDGIGAKVPIDDVGNYYMGERLPEAINTALGFVMLFAAGAEAMEDVEVEDEPTGKPKDGMNS